MLETPQNLLPQTTVALVAVRPRYWSANLVIADVAKTSFGALLWRELKVVGFPGSERRLR